MSQQVLTSTYLHGMVDRYADLAQLAERIHGKDKGPWFDPGSASCEQVGSSQPFLLSTITQVIKEGFWEGKK